MALTLGKNKTKYTRRNYMDYQVLAVQNWLLDRYTGKPEFDAFVTSKNFRANGSTGSNTMQALRMALQYELGISGPTGNFGPGTLAVTPTVSLSATPTNLHIIKILEAAMWCHGYYPGGAFEPLPLTPMSESVAQGLQTFMTDIGLFAPSTGDVSIDPYLWKALLSTDAYTTTWTQGNLQLREIQKKLNTVRVNGRNVATAYYGGYIPTDGVGGRELNKFLIFYLQSLMGLTPADATGNFGPATQQSLPNISDNTTSEHYFNILKAGLILNRIFIESVNDGWDKLQSKVLAYQKDRVIPQTGIVDKTTWMALLTSHGDQNRTPNACDTRFEITNSRADYLLSKGIKYVGRYLTGGDFKGLRLGEAQRLKSKGLTVFPIYQGSGDTTSISYYTVAQAAISADEARTAAIKFGFPKGATIYFAVDLDTYGYQIDETIIPYFRKISQSLADYKVGIYATRLGCSKVLEKGYATQAFVANMSSGWSGNLGFPMPKSWTFEQYIEHKNIPSPDMNTQSPNGLWDLDYCIYSGKFPVPVVDEVDDPTLLDNALYYIKNLVNEVGSALKFPSISYDLGLYEMGQEITLVKTPNLIYTLKFNASTNYGLTDDPNRIKNSEFVVGDNNFKTQLQNDNYTISSEVSTEWNKALEAVPEILSSIRYGSFQMSTAVTANGTIKIIYSAIQETSEIFNISSDIKVDFIMEVIPDGPNSGSLPELVPVGAPEYVLALVAAGAFIYLTGGTAAPAAEAVVQAILSLFSILSLGS